MAPFELIRHLPDSELNYRRLNLQSKRKVVSRKNPAILVKFSTDFFIDQSIEKQVVRLGENNSGFWCYLIFFWTITDRESIFICRLPPI